MQCLKKGEWIMLTSSAKTGMSGKRRLFETTTGSEHTPDETTDKLSSAEKFYFIDWILALFQSTYQILLNR